MNVLEHGDAKLRDHHVLGINELNEWAATQWIDVMYITSVRYNYFVTNAIENYLGQRTINSGLMSFFACGLLDLLPFSAMVDFVVFKRIRS